MKIDFKPDVTFRGAEILKQADGLAYAYETTDASADADGPPNAYHPSDLGKDCAHDIHRGLDCLQNAGYPHSDWWQCVLVTDPHDKTKPFIQTDGIFAGFYVSMTSLRDKGGVERDPATYVDATKVPYVVIPQASRKSYLIRPTKATLDSPHTLPRGKRYRLSSRTLAVAPTRSSVNHHSPSFRLLGSPTLIPAQEQGYQPIQSNILSSQTLTLKARLNGRGHPKISPTKLVNF